MNDITINFLKEIITKSLQREIEAELDKAKTKALEIIEQRKGEIVAGVMIDIMKQADFQMLQDRVVITIRKP